MISGVANANTIPPLLLGALAGTEVDSLLDELRKSKDDMLEFNQNVVSPTAETASLSRPRPPQRFGPHLPGAAMPTC